MTVQALADIIIGLSLVGWISYRQLTWRIVSISRMWRVPLILGAVGVVMIAQVKGGHPISAVDLAVLVIELVISLGIGLVMGRIAVFRARTIRPGSPGDPLAGRRRDRGDRGRQARYEHALNADGSETVLESRTGWLGLALWIVLIMVRVGIDFVAADLGSTLASATGVILVMVAANRIAPVFIFASRVQNSSTITA